MKVMDHMQKSNIPQTRKQAGFTDDEVTASEQQYYSLDTSISIQKITDPIITSYHPSPSLWKLNAWYIDSGVCWGFWGYYDLWTKVFRQAFAKYDLDGNGKLAREELPPLLENLHIQMRILVSKLVATGVIPFL